MLLKREYGNFQAADGDGPVPIFLIRSVSTVDEGGWVDGDGSMEECIELNKSGKNQDEFCFILIKEGLWSLAIILVV